MNNFLLEASEYKRDIDVIKGYMEQAPIFLSRMTGTSYEQAAQWVKTQLAPGGKFEIKAPKCTVNFRDLKTGDKHRTTTTIDAYLKKIIDNNLITSGALTAYVPPSVKQSIPAKFIAYNVEQRAIAKNKMFLAKDNGDTVMANNYDIEQAAKKLRNNAMSGANASRFTSLHNKSTHPTLTMFCRASTSYANAGNEKLAGSSRHYYLPSIVIQNIVSTIHLTDFEAFQFTLEKFNIVYPTVEDTMACIKRSTKKYFTNRLAMADIEDFVKTLAPVERAAFVYIGDLYQVAKLNRGFMVEFIDKLITPYAGEEFDVEFTKEKLIDGDVIAYASALRPDIISKGSFKRLKGTPELQDEYHVMLGTINKIKGTIAEYAGFIRNFLLTPNVPTTVASVPYMVRNISMASDTDSSMATAQWWCEWYLQEPIFHTDLADNIADTIIYLAAQNVGHLIANMSAHMGVPEKLVFEYQMKNEYKFKVFAVTNKAKHYFSLITSQEGVMNEDPELEMKGVGLRTSKIPPIIMTEYRKTVRDMLMDVMEGRNIKLFPIIKRIGDIEIDIMKDVMSGSIKYLKTGQIKPGNAYSDPASSAYFYHTFWNETFGRVYGELPEPTYDVVKLPVMLENKTSITAWINNIKNKELANILKAWFERNPKRKFNMFLISTEFAESKGIPIEMLQVADIRNTAFSSVEPYYHIIDTLGIRLIDQNRTRLFSDLQTNDLELPSERIQALGV